MALAAIWLGACDPKPTPNATVSRAVDPEVIAPGETLTDVVREALADVMRDEDPYARARRLGALLPTLGPELIPAVEHTLEDPTLILGATEYELLLRYWATHQPEEDSRWAVEKSPPFFRIAAVIASFELWAEADPQAALSAAEEWIAHRPDVRDVLPKALVIGWFAKDPSEVAQFIHDLGVGIPRQRALSTYVRVAIQKQGPDAVIRWAESLTDDDATYKMAVVRQLASVLSLIDLEAGLRWCEAHCDGPHGKNLRSIVARRWARSDGAAALAWLSRAPEGPEKDFDVRVVFEDWAQLEPEAALAWITDQTTGELDPWLHPTLPVYVRMLSVDSPAEAVKWAERIEHDNKRRFALIEAARVWRQVDEAAAEAWLLESSLSEEDRERVRAPEWDRRI
jgi:hypothetical protein